MKLKYRSGSGKAQVLDLDARCTVGELLDRVQAVDVLFGQPPRSLLRTYSRSALLVATALRTGDLVAEGGSEQLSASAAVRTSSGHNTNQDTKDDTSRKRIKEVIVLDDDDNVKSSANISSKLRKDDILCVNPPRFLFYQNPIDVVGIPKCEEACTRALWDLVVGENLLEAYVLTFCIDLENTIKKLFPQLRKVPVALSIGDRSVTSDMFEDCFPSFGSRLIFPPCPPYGTHHSKMFVLFYGEGGVRVIIHTSNLETTNLFMQTEGWWHQDFPVKATGQRISGSRENDFEEYLGRVLAASGIPEAPRILSKYDFATAEVALVATLPRTTAYTVPSEIAQNGIGRVNSLLERERVRCPEWFAMVKSWPVILQGSSLGSQASKVSASANWVIDEIGRAMGAMKASQVELVCASREEVMATHYQEAGASNTFFKRENFVSEEVKRALRPWTPSNVGLPTRSLLLPHFKSYLCYEPSTGREVGWAMIGSHNCTKAAWGSWTSSMRNKLTCLSYELSVMFLPSIMRSAGSRRWCVIQRTWIEVGVRDVFVSDIGSTRPTESILPLPFKLPLRKYDFGVETPFTRD